MMAGPWDPVDSSQPARPPQPQQRTTPAATALGGTTGPQPVASPRAPQAAAGAGALAQRQAAPPPPGEWDVVSVAPAPPEVREVGFAESAARTAGAAAQPVVRTLGLAAGGVLQQLKGVAQLADQIAPVFGLQSDVARRVQEAQDRVFQQSDQLQTSMRDVYNPRPGEEFSTPGAITGGVLSMPIEVVGGMGSQRGVERAADVLQRGGSGTEAAVAGVVTGGANVAANALPIKVGGKVGAAIEQGLGKVLPGGARTGAITGAAATGGALGAGADIGVAAAENAALPEGEAFQDLRREAEPAASGGLGAALAAGAEIITRGKARVPPKGAALAQPREGGVNVSMKPVSGFYTPEAITKFVDERIESLRNKGKGTPDQEVPGPDGKKVKVRGKLAEFVSPDDRAELDFLKRNRENLQAIADGYGFGIEGPTGEPAKRAAAGADQTDVETQRRERARNLPVGIELTKGQASRDFEQQQFERETAKDGKTGEKLRATYADQNDRVTANLDALFELTGAEMPDVRGAGKRVVDAVAKRAAEVKGEVDAEYQRAREAGQMAEEVDTTALVTKLRDIAPSATNAGVIKTAEAELIRLGGAKRAEDGSLVPGRLSVDALEELRKTVGVGGRKDATNAHFANEIKQSIDMATDAAGGDIYRSARAKYRAYAEEFKNRKIVADLISTKRGTDERRVALEDVHKRTIKDGSVEEITKLRDTLRGAGLDGQQAWRELQGQTIAEIRDAALRNRSVNERGQTVVSAAGMNRVIKNLDADGKLDLVFGKKGAEILRDLNDLAADVYTAPPGSVNFSNTASALKNVFDNLVTYGISGLPVPAREVMGQIGRMLRSRGIRKRVDEAVPAAQPARGGEIKPGVFEPPATPPAAPPAPRGSGPSGPSSPPGQGKLFPPDGGSGGASPAPRKQLLGRAPDIPKLPTPEVIEDRAPRIPVPEVIEGPDPVPAGQARELADAELDAPEIRDWLKAHRFGEQAGADALRVDKALQIDPDAVQRAATQHAKQPTAFVRAVDQIIEGANKDATDTSSAARGGEGLPRQGRGQEGDQQGEGAGQAAAAAAPDPESLIVNPIDRTASKDEKVRQLAALTVENKPIVQRFLRDIDAELGTVSKDSVKENGKIGAKASRPEILARKPWHDVEHIRDSYRFKTVLDSIDQLPEIASRLRALGAEIVKADVDKVLRPKEFGWRIAAFDLRMPNGQLVEYYLPVRELEEAKKNGGHKLFEEVRNLDLSDPLQRAKYDEIAAKSRAHYDAAWEAYLRRSGVSASAVRAALSKALAAPSSSLSKPAANVPAGTLGAGDAQAPERSRFAEKSPGPNSQASTDPSAFQAISAGDRSLVSTGSIIPSSAPQRGLPNGGADEAPAAIAMQEFERSTAPTGNPIADNLSAKLRADYPGAVREYGALKDSKGGRVLNTDIARELSSDYLQNRARAADVQEPAGAFIARRYAEKLAAPTPEGLDRRVMFTAGGPGAGKSTAVDGVLAEEVGNAELVYDTTMGGQGSSIAKIEQALAAGREVTVAYVYAKPEEAFKLAMQRAMDQKREFGSGRTVPLRVFVDDHVGASRTIRSLADRYRHDLRVEFSFIDNTRGLGNAAAVDLRDLPVVADNRLRETLEAAAQEAFREGRIDAETLAGFLADPQPQPRARPAAGGSEGLVEADRGRPEQGGQGQGLNALAAPSGPPGPVGFPTSVVTERGLRVPVRYRLVEADDVITSHDNDLRVNPAYPPEMQPRDRTRASSEDQVARIANGVVPELLADSPKASDGAPIIGPDGLVESGNGRTIGLRRAYGMGKAEEYRAWLAENAQRFGLTPEQVAAVKRPMLVRERTADVDRVDFARQANDPAVAAMSDAEQAAVDARYLPDLELLHANDDGTLNLFQSADFIRGFLQTVASPADRGRLITAKGRLSLTGINRIRHAVFFKAYGAPDLVASLAESPDGNIKNILGGLLRAAPKVARLREMSEAGVRGDVSFVDDLADAVQRFSEAREASQSVDDYLAQGSLIGGEASPRVADFMRQLEIDSRAPRRIAEWIDGMVRAADDVGDPREASLLGEPRAKYRAGSLADDLDRQKVYLEQRARAAGHDSVDAFAAADMDGFLRAASEWRDANPATELREPGGDYLTNVHAAAGELAGQIQQEARLRDFKPSELPLVLRDWAQGAGVAADDLRQRLLHVLERSDLGAGRLRQVREALDPTRGLLTPPTREGLQAAADRAAGVEKADAAEQKRLADKAAADAQRDEFTLTGSNSAADLAAAAGQGSLFEPGAHYSSDLFGNPVESPAPRRGALRPVRRETPADTDVLPGDYMERTIVGTETRRKLGAAAIKTPADLAAATRYLYKSAVERLDGVVTDSNGKPLAVIGGFKGALTQTSVYPSTLVAEAVRVPGAAKLWLSHNHPSGTAELSHADETMEAKIRQVFDGTGIEVQGIAAIAGDSYAFAGGAKFARGSGKIPEPATEADVPVVERELVPDPKGKGWSISGPKEARAAALRFYQAAGNRPGMLLLDAQHRPVAYVPIPTELEGKLKGTGGLRAVYRAISEANAGAAIIVHGGELDRGNPKMNVPSIGTNIARALQQIDVRVLDDVNVNNGRSRADDGTLAPGGAVWSVAALTAGAGALAMAGQDDDDGGS